MKEADGMIDEKRPEKKPNRGQLRIDEEECKGCGLCIEASPVGGAPMLAGYRRVHGEAGV